MRLFAYRLAKEMGRPDVDAMLAEMPAWQLAEWAAFLEWEHEMEQRDIMQSTADARIAAMKRGG